MLHVHRSLLCLLYIATLRLRGGFFSSPLVPLLDWQLLLPLLVDSSYPFVHVAPFVLVALVLLLVILVVMLDVLLTSWHVYLYQALGGLVGVVFPE